MIRFKSEKLLELQSIRGFIRVLERFKMSKNLISKPIFQEIFVYICLESRIRSFRVESIELWSKKRTNIESAKFEKIVSNKMY